MKIKIIDWVKVSICPLTTLFVFLWGFDFRIPLNIYIGLIVFIYLYSIFIFRIFYFYDDYYEVLFPTRIFYRRKKVFYNEIENVTYLVGFRTGIFLMVAKYGHKGFYSRSYAIPCNSLKKEAKPLVLIFRSKGININFDCSEETKKEFEEM